VIGDFDDSGLATCAALNPFARFWEGERQHVDCGSSTEIIPVLSYALIIQPSFSKSQYIKEIGQNSPSCVGLYRLVIRHA
jgi:hypothetical protein